MKIAPIQKNQSFKSNNKTSEYPPINVKEHFNSVNNGIIKRGVLHKNLLLIYTSFGAMLTEALFDLKVKTKKPPMIISLALFLGTFVKCHSEAWSKHYFKHLKKNKKIDNRSL